MGCESISHRPCPPTSPTPHPHPPHLHTVVNQPCEEADSEGLLEEALLDEVDVLESACEVTLTLILP